MYSGAMPSENKAATANTHRNETQRNFVEQAKARIQRMKYMAEEVTRELGLPPEAKYDVLAVLATFNETKNLSSSVSDSQVGDILEQYGPYISILARSYAHQILRAGIIEDEIEDIAQEARLKLWETVIAKRKSISHPKAYIHHIIRNLCVDRTRRAMLLPLPEDADGELLQGSVLIIPGEGLQDPAHEFEQKEVLTLGCAAMAAEILKLPHVQRCAIVVWLKERRDETSLLLLYNLKKRGLDINAISSPKKADEMLRQRASLLIARRRLRKLNFFA
jgi:DNA-directed RNA polymerase specialized sigma24 family protein